MKAFSVLLTVLLCAFPLISCGQYSSGESSDASDVFAGTSSADETSVLLPPGKISIVALGDSIAYGARLENYESDRWSARLAEKLKTVYAEADEANYGVNGMTGEGLVTQLENEMPAEIAECDYVLISIGGNNILSFLTSLTQELFPDGEYPTQLFADFFKYAFASTSEDVSQYAYSVAEMNSLVARINATFESEDYRQKVALAGEKLKDELPRAVALIRECNKDAKIIVQSIYNPYYGINLSFRYLESGIDLSAHGEFAVASLNEAITSCAVECGYEIADVYTAFKESGVTLTNAGIDLGTMTLDLDPHPNKKGHELIAQTYYDLIAEGKNG